MNPVFARTMALGLLLTSATTGLVGPEYLAPEEYNHPKEQGGGATSFLFTPSGDDDADARRQMELMDEDKDDKADKREVLNYIIRTFYKDKHGNWAHHDNTHMEPNKVCRSGT
jgi:predicted small lipoprotein YifL